MPDWQRRLRVFDLPADALERPGLAERGEPGAEHSARACSSGGEPADSAAPALRVFEGETVYDYAWYPGMLASEPASCVFASTSRVRCAPLCRACSSRRSAGPRAWGVAA